MTAPTLAIQLTPKDFQSWGMLLATTRFLLAMVGLPLVLESQTPWLIWLFNLGFISLMLAATLCAVLRKAYPNAELEVTVSGLSILAHLFLAGLTQIIPVPTCSTLYSLSYYYYICLYLRVMAYVALFCLLTGALLRVATYWIAKTPVAEKPVAEKPVAEPVAEPMADRSFE